MKIVVLGDKLREGEAPDGIFPGAVPILIVYKYTDAGDYGWGQAIGLGEDNLVLLRDLGHCCCYGPMERRDHVPISMKGFLTQKWSELGRGVWEVRTRFLEEVLRLSEGTEATS